MRYRREETTIHLARHGQTENPLGLVKGNLPGFGLSKIGREQVNEAAAHLERAHPSSIFSSPLQRSRETARIFMAHFPTASSGILFSLREWEYPRWENVPLAVVKARYPAEWHAYLTHSTRLSDPAGETLGDAQHRMLSEIERLRHRFAGETIILCSHGDPILCVRAYFEHVNLNHFKTLECELGSLTTLTFDAHHDWPTVTYWAPATGPRQDEDQRDADGIQRIGPPFRVNRTIVPTSTDGG